MCSVFFIRINLPYLSIPCKWALITECHLAKVDVEGSTCWMTGKQHEMKSRRRTVSVKLEAESATPDA